MIPRYHDFFVVEYQRSSVFRKYNSSAKDSAVTKILKLSETNNLKTFFNKFNSATCFYLYLCHTFFM